MQFGTKWYSLVQSGTTSYIQYQILRGGRTLNVALVSFGIRRLAQPALPPGFPGHIRCPPKGRKRIRVWRVRFRFFIGPRTGVGIPPPERAGRLPHVGQPMRIRAYACVRMYKYARDAYICPIWIAAIPIRAYSMPQHDPANDSAAQRVRPRTGRDTGRRDEHGRSTHPQPEKLRVRGGGAGRRSPARTARRLRRQRRGRRGRARRHRARRRGGGPGRRCGHGNLGHRRHRPSRRLGQPRPRDLRGQHEHLRLQPHPRGARALLQRRHRDRALPRHRLGDLRRRHHLHLQRRRGPRVLRRQPRHGGGLAVDLRARHRDRDLELARLRREHRPRRMPRRHHGDRDAQAARGGDARQPVDLRAGRAVQGLLRRGRRAGVPERHHRHRPVHGAGMAARRIPHPGGQPQLPHRRRAARARRRVPRGGRRQLPHHPAAGRRHRRGDRPGLLHAQAARDRRELPAAP